MKCIIVKVHARAQYLYLPSYLYVVSRCLYVPGASCFPAPELFGGQLLWRGQYKVIYS